MKVLAGSDVARRIEGLVDPSLQVEERAVALTARAVYRLESASRLDLTGAEYHTGERTALATEVRDGDAPWWLLEEGTYLVATNESLNLPSGSLGFLYPHPWLLEGGAHHPTILVAGSRQPQRPLVPLSVCERGLALRENGRVSLLVVVT